MITALQGGAAQTTQCDNETNKFSEETVYLYLFKGG